MIQNKGQSEEVERGDEWVKGGPEGIEGALRGQGGPEKLPEGVKGVEGRGT